MAILIQLGVIQGLIISLVLWNRKTASKAANKLLALFIGSLSLVNFEDYLIASRHIFVLPHLYAVFSPLVFALGPLFFLYIKHITHGQLRFKPQILLHFLPWLLLTMLLAFTFYFQDATLKKAQILEDLSVGDDNLFTYAMILQCSVYVCLSLREIIKHNTKLKDRFSFTEGLTLKTPFFLLFILLVMWMVWGIGKVFFPGKLTNTDDLFFTLFVYAFGYLALMQRPLPPPMQKVEAEDDRPSARKPQAKNLSDAEARELYEQVRGYMEQNKPYLQKELGIQDLSDLTGIGVNQLSSVINSIGGQNFFDFVNSYRVEEFKRQVENPDNQHFTLLAIAFDCGFNSKAAFNSFFKKKTGLTPSQYKSGLKTQETAENAGLET